MAQNIYDNPDFFAGYSQLPRQVHGLDGAPEWPAIRACCPRWQAGAWLIWAAALAGPLAGFASKAQLRSWGWTCRGT